MRIGTKHTKETKQKISKNNGRYWLGKKRPSFSKEWKDKIKEARKKQIGENSSNWKGGLPSCIDCNKKLNSYKKKRCINCRIIYLKQNPPFKNKKHSNNTRSILREKTINQLQKGTLKQDTSIEISMKNLLDSLDIKYEHPYNFNNKFLCDFAIIDKKIIIEV